MGHIYCQHLPRSCMPGVRAEALHQICALQVRVGEQTQITNVLWQSINPDVGGEPVLQGDLCGIRAGGGGETWPDSPTSPVPFQSLIVLASSRNGHVKIEGAWVPRFLAAAYQLRAACPIACNSSWGSPETHHLTH